MNLRKVLDSGYVTRYHSTLVEIKQPVSSHSWEVSVILMQIYPQASAQLLFYALTHDCAEAKTGDIPAPLKWENPEFKCMLDRIERDYCKNTLFLPEWDLTDEEKLAVKYADVLSGIYFTKKRLDTGDRHAEIILGRWVEYFERLPYLNGRVHNALVEVLNAPGE